MRIVIFLFIIGMLALVLYGYTIRGDVPKEIGFGITIAVIIILFTYIEITKKNDKQ